MKKIIFLALTLVVGATACDDKTSPSTSTTTTSAMAPPPSTMTTPPAASNPGMADNTNAATNTGINDRDRDGGSLTPMDQGGGGDRDITAAVRKAVVGDSALSYDAKNVKIITQAGKVTLRGPVKSAAEKTSIEAKAKAVSGVTSVDDQLEVAAQK